jgi:hypothetical protein
VFRFPIASFITGLTLAMIGTALWMGEVSPAPVQRIDHAIPLVTTTQPAQSPQLVSSVGPSLSTVGAEASPVDPHLTIGAETCVKCHAGEVNVWKATPHARTFDELHRRPEAQAIAAKLGIQSIKHDGRCVDCHYTTQIDPSTASPHAIAGVSCESCHGAARNWIDVHHNYGGEHITRAMETPEHRNARWTRSIELGMRNPVNVYLVAQSCLRCHTTSDEQLVNVGGHSAGSLDFEFVSWSQGTLRHNFVRSDGQRNDVSSIERLRVMFVSGMIAELESSLRGTAAATQKAAYGVTVAQRAARAVQRLQSVSTKIDSPILIDILRVMTGVQLKLNNREELTRAADAIADLGYRFAAETDGRALSTLDAFIPPTDRWK